VLQRVIPCEIGAQQQTAKSGGKSTRGKAGVHRPSRVHKGELMDNTEFSADQRRRDRERKHAKRKRTAVSLHLRQRRTAQEVGGARTSMASANLAPVTTTSSCERTGTWVSCVSCWFALVLTAFDLLPVRSAEVLRLAKLEFVSDPSNAEQPGVGLQWGVLRGMKEAVGKGRIPDFACLGGAAVVRAGWRREGAKERAVGGRALGCSHSGRTPDRNSSSAAHDTHYHPSLPDLVFVLGLVSWLCLPVTRL
jgi:hypothetical protein